MRIKRTLPALLLIGIVSAGLVACSSSAPVKHSDTSTKPEKTPASSSAPAAPAAPAGDFVTADWAKPVTNPGDLLVTLSGKDFTVNVYQVGTIAASKHGQFADPDGKTIISVGDKLVYVNYVATNTGTADILLSYSLVDVQARYADWPYLQGMDSVVDFDADAQMKVNNSAFAIGAPDAPFVWKAGTSFSFGENFLYEANSPITFKASLVPADKNGDLVHDQKQEVSGDATIK